MPRGGRPRLFGGVSRITGPAKNVLDFIVTTEVVRQEQDVGGHFPFRIIRLLGAAQLTVALLIQVITVIQISMGYMDRYIFLAKASVDVWTPLPAIAAGIVGIAMSERKYWETKCMKVSYFILSIASGAVFMMILLFVTGMIEFKHFDLIPDAEPTTTTPITHSYQSVLPETSNSTSQVNAKLHQKAEKDFAHKAMTVCVVILALLELVLSFLSVIVVCYSTSSIKSQPKPKDQTDNTEQPYINNIMMSPAKTSPRLPYRKPSIFAIMMDKGGRVISPNPLAPRPQHPVIEQQRKYTAKSLNVMDKLEPSAPPMYMLV